MKYIRAFVVACLILASPYVSNAQVRVVGSDSSAGHIVPTQQRIRPAGETVAFAGRPVDMTLSPDGKRLYCKHNAGLIVVDVESWEILQELRFENRLGASMHGIAITSDDRTLYVTTAQNAMMEAKVDEDGNVAWGRRIPLPGPRGGNDASHATGIALDEQNGTAYVCLSRNNLLVAVDLESGDVQREVKVGIAPYDVVLSADGEQAYVSNWGGRHPENGERTAPSSGTETLIDERGVASSGTVSLIDLEDFSVTATFPTGLHPSDLALDTQTNRLYVANVNSDSVTIIDTDGPSVVSTFSARPDARLPFGSMPNALALSVNGNRLYFANGGNNAVGVADVASDNPTVQGYIPAGWYPGSLLVHDNHLFVANVKGVGSRNGQGANGWKVFSYRGTISKVPLPSPTLLDEYTAQVRKDARIPQGLSAWERGLAQAAPTPVPKQMGDPSVFEHVVYVIKENRTYDQLFGDLPQGNGDAALCIYPREITPNHHALAEEFVLLDNYYCNGVNSADGHSWTTEGNVTDHLEKSFGGFTRSYTWGNDPLTYSSSGFIWDNILLKGLSFRNYGEFDYATPVPSNSSFVDIYDDMVTGTPKITYTQNIGIERLRQFSSVDYPGWNMKIPDVRRAEIFIDDLQTYERNGDFPNFTIVYLPQDHTSGTTPGEPTPRAHLADNDLALGRVVEAISKSSFWKKTCIFVIEDDPQDGFDHVDGHRSICLVVSPYTKRGAVVSNFYNQTSVLHTMARMLSVPPMNQMDSMSPVMETCFTPTPNFESYTALANTVPLNELNPPRRALSEGDRHWAEESLRQPFERFDEADEDTLNRILWHAARGSDAPYPEHYAGAHGAGLEGLQLVLNGSASDD